MHLGTLLAQSSSPSAGESVSQALNDALGGLTSAPWPVWLGLLGGILLGVLIGRLIQTGLRRAARFSESHHHDGQQVLLNSAISPTGLFLLTAGIHLGLMWGISRYLSPPVEKLAQAILAFLYSIAIGWFLYNLVDLVDLWLRKVAAKTASKLDDQIAPLIRKTLRIFLVVVFTLFIAQNVFGANIGAWLAGLGIAGLAVSLAAQDSVKNFFGSVTILLDRPFAVGDFITIGDFSGTVSEIGFRSTRLWTLAGSFVTIPNGKITDTVVDNISRRKSIRRVMDITITYDTPAQKVEQAIQLVKEVLADPTIAQAFDLQKLPPRVYFTDLKSDCLNIQCMYWYTPPDYWAYMQHAQNVNLLLFKRFNEAGIEFSFPTQTLYLAGDPNRPLPAPPNRTG